MKTSPPKMDPPTGSDELPADEIEEEALERKRFATLAARAALAGHSLTADSSGFTLSRWTHSKHCGDLDTVENLLSRMGVKS